jgi:hypothetical protein
MADEFAKGLGIAVTGGLGWMVLAGWYNTPSFEGQQLIAPNPENVEGYSQLALILKEAFFWFAILGMLTFWVLIPAINEARDTWADRQS